MIHGRIDQDSTRPERWIQPDTEQQSPFNHFEACSRHHPPGSHTMSARKISTMHWCSLFEAREQPLRLLNEFWEGNQILPILERRRRRFLTSLFALIEDFE